MVGLGGYGSSVYMAVGNSPNHFGPDSLCPPDFSVEKVIDIIDIFVCKTLMGWVVYDLFMYPSSKNIIWKTSDSVMCLSPFEVRIQEAIAVAWKRWGRGGFNR